MAEKPILFSGEMVRAILEGRKTQTRRVMIRNAPRTVNGVVTWYPGGEKLGFKYTGVDGHSIEVASGWAASWCPYGAPGDRLWVRETWAQLCEADELTGECDIAYRADDWPENEPGPDYIKGTWRPSIFMPRWASRITLEVTGVRVEQVQAISEYDQYWEGLVTTNFVTFSSLWDSINAKRGYPWSSNPWVWVVSFRLAAPPPRLAPDPASCVNHV